MEQGLNDDDWITKQAIYMYRKVDPFLHKHPKKKRELKKSQSQKYWILILWGDEQDQCLTIYAISTSF